MFIEQPPRILRALYPGAIWRMNPDERTVYLTFDDGPIPGVTPWVLETLDRYDIKATFFMVGDNVRKHPQEHRMVVDHGHRVGNHTFNHVKGFGSPLEAYMSNTLQANELLETDLFRPPHGHMTRGQYLALKEHYRIIMWDVVTRDYSKRLKGKHVFRKVKKYARNGSIITFHDSIKSEESLKYALPRSIEWLKEQGYGFGVL